MLIDLKIGQKFGHSTLHFLKLIFFFSFSLMILLLVGMWNSFEVLLKQRLQPVLLAVKNTSHPGTLFVPDNPCFKCS